MNSASQSEGALLHPSFLALDRAHLGRGSAEVEAHLAVCEECRAHLEALANPGFLPGIAAVRDAVNAPSRSRGAWLWAAVSLAAVACALLLFVGTRPPRALGGDEAYVGAKGFRSVWIYVKRGAETRLWDGKRPLAFGDRVRLKVDPGGYRHLEVYSMDALQRPTLLFEGPLSPGENVMLPDAWEIDDSPGAERLFVVFSDGPAKPDWDAWLRGDMPRGAELLPFVLPKAGRAGVDAGSLGP